MNISGNCIFINIYAPQGSSAKARLWDELRLFMNSYQGHCILFGEFNEFRFEEVRSLV